MTGTDWLVVAVIRHTEQYREGKLRWNKGGSKVIIQGASYENLSKFNIVFYFSNFSNNKDVTGKKTENFCQFFKRSFYNSSVFWKFNFQQLLGPSQ